MKITFLGASGTVTGSRFLVATDRTRVLVDCVLFQGLKANRLRNWEPFPVAPSDIDAVVLTHAHLDHSGFLPVPVREGFRGAIHCTAPTADLCEILILDSGKIQEEDARRANRKGYSKHSPAMPLYTKKEARSVFPRLEPLSFDAPLTLGDLSIRLSPAGHILGAGMAHVSDGERSVLFSGDLGGDGDLLIRRPTHCVARSKRRCRFPLTSRSTKRPWTSRSRLRLSQRAERRSPPPRPERHRPYG